MKIDVFKPNNQSQGDIHGSVNDIVSNIGKDFDFNIVNKIVEMISNVLCIFFNFVSAKNVEKMWGVHVPQITLKFGLLKILHNVYHIGDEIPKHLELFNF